jgi:hypothetical protein
MIIELEHTLESDEGSIQLSKERDGRLRLTIRDKRPEKWENMKFDISLADVHSLEHLCNTLFNALAEER